MDTHNSRVKKYNNIRILLLIALVTSLAGNFHQYLLYNNAIELLYICNLDKAIDSSEQSISQTSMSKSDRELLESEIKKEREHSKELNDKVASEKYYGEVIRDMDIKGKDIMKRKKQKEN